VEKSLSRKKLLPFNLPSLVQVSNAYDHKLNSGLENICYFGNNGKEILANNDALLVWLVIN
jgi:hypothetical protein